VQLADAALKHLQLGSKRQPQQSLLQLYNSEQAQADATAHTTIDVIADDLPFLVDSLCMVLTRFGLNIHLIVHPVLSVTRTGSGLWRGLATSAAKESWQRYEIDRVSDPQKLSELHDALASALEDVSRVCADWQAMRKRALALCASWQHTPPRVENTEVQEAASFLEWLVANHFTFLGSQEFTLRRGARLDVLQPVARTALGLMRRDHAKEVHAVQLEGELRAQARAVQLVLITKSASYSTVHRAAHLDQISIKQFDTRGRVIGETRFLGLFTSTVYSTAPHEVPLLRHKLERVITALRLLPGSHDAKAVQHVIDNYPRDELFQSSSDELARTVRSIVNLYERRKVRLFLRRDPFHRFYSGLLYLPRDRYNTQVRERIEGHLLAALRGSHVESQVLMSDSALARLHLLIRTTAATRAIDEDALENDITHLIRTWHDELAAALITEHGEAEGRQLAA
jgi:glutamate dehydrogenase